MKLASLMPWGISCGIWKSHNLRVSKVYNWFCKDRSMPKLSKISWNKWYKTKFKPTVKNPIKTVYLFVDELLNFNEAEIGIATVTLLDRLGYGIKFSIIKNRDGVFFLRDCWKKHGNLQGKCEYFQGCDHFKYAVDRSGAVCYSHLSRRIPRSVEERVKKKMQNALRRTLHDRRVSRE